MLKKFLGDSKELVQKYRVNKKYTSDERVQEIRKILFQELPEKNTDEKKEQLLLIALEIGHPLKVNCLQIQGELYRYLEIAFIELIHCKENQNQDASQYYISLDAINSKTYTVIAHKLKLIEQDILRARSLRFHHQQKLFEQKIEKYLNIPIERSHLCEKESAIYVEDLRNKHYSKKAIKKVTLSMFIFSYFGFAYKYRKVFMRINKLYSFALFGLASAIFYYFA